MTLDCYMVAFFDESGFRYSVPFSKADDGSHKADLLLKALREIGLDAEKYGPYKRRT